MFGKKFFKTVVILIFIVFLFGCSHKYVDARGRSLDEKIVNSWEELDCKVVEQDELGFSLSVEVGDVILVGDSLRSGELYKTKPLGEGAGWILLGGTIGLCGGVVGLREAIWSLPEVGERGCLISFGSCLTGIGVAGAGIGSRREMVKGMPDLAKGDTVCVDNEILSNQQIDISVEGEDFEKEYYTDGNGNVELKFDEIILEPTDADSVLNVIIRYYDLVDTVRVECL